MSLSTYRVQPRKGHLTRAKRIFSYLAYLPDGWLRSRTGEPGFKYHMYGWSRMVYGGVKEHIPENISTPRGMFLITTMGRSVTAIMPEMHIQLCQKHGHMFSCFKNMVTCSVVPTDKCSVIKQ